MENFSEEDVMKNKLVELTSVIVVLSAVFMPNSMRADEEAKALLAKLRSSEDESINTVDRALVQEAENFLTGKGFLKVTEEGVLNLRDWPKDIDQENLLKYMLTLDLGWDLFVFRGVDGFRDACGDEGCGLKSLRCDYRLLPESFLKSLKTNQCLKRLSVQDFNREELESLAEAIQSSNLEEVRLWFLSRDFIEFANTSSIAKALLDRPHLARLGLEGRFDVLPLFTTHDCKTIEYMEGSKKVEIEVERSPQLRCLDLRRCEIPGSHLSWLREHPRQKLFLPEILVVSWEGNSVEFTKDLVSRGGNIETLTIECAEVGDNEMVALIEIMKQNHSEGGSLSHIRFINSKGDVACLKSGEELRIDTRRSLKKVLQASKFPMRLELRGLSILGQKDRIETDIEEGEALLSRVEATKAESTNDCTLAEGVEEFFKEEGVLREESVSSFVKLGGAFLVMQKEKWLSLQKWPDIDQEELLKYMLTLNLGWNLRIPSTAKEFTAALDACGDEGCGLMSLRCDYRLLPESFLKSLKTNQCLKRLSVQVFSKEELESLAEALLGSNLESVEIESDSEEFIKTSPIGKALLKAPGLCLKLCGNFDVWPLFTTCGNFMIGTRKMFCCPEMKIFDLRGCKIDPSNLESLRNDQEQKIFLPEELRVCWDNDCVREFTKELVNRNKNCVLRTLIIECDKLDNEKIGTLIDMIKIDKRSWAEEGLSIWIFNSSGLIAELDRDVDVATKNGLKEVQKGWHGDLKLSGLWN